MGSHPKQKRNPKDAPIIKVPIVVQSSSSFAKGLPELADEKCITSFEEFLEDSPLLKSGLAVDILQIGERFPILIQGSEIGLMSKRNTARIKECLQLKVRYIGEIIKKKDDYYARFTRQLN